MGGGAELLCSIKRSAVSEKVISEHIPGAWGREPVSTQRAGVQQEEERRTSAILLSEGGRMTAESSGLEGGECSWSEGREEGLGMLLRAS